MSLKTLAVIPARYASTRLPGKPLLSIAGVPLILRVLRGVRRCGAVDRVVVATDDRRIADAVTRDGGEAIMTPADLPSGGDRVAYVARQISSEYVINVQGDDPLVDADMIEPPIAALEADHDFLTEGDVFTDDLIETYIKLKREEEIAPAQLRPTPLEFEMYFDC